MENNRTVLGLLPEIWTSIFQHAVFSDPPDIGWYGSGVLTAIRLTEVCKAWRDLVIGLQELWEWIDCYEDPLRMDLSIQRAGTRPLSFSLLVDWDTGDHPYCLSIVGRQIHRLKALYLLYGEDYSEYELPSWTVPAPHLEILHLERFCLPENLFNQQMPRLRDLELDRCGFCWEDFYHLPQLLHLSILQSFESTTGTDINTLIKVLEHCPNLKSLKVSGALREGSDAGGTVNLQNLQSLSISEDNCQDTIEFLHHLTFPHTACVRLTLSVSQDARREYEDVLEALKRSRVGSTWRARTVTIVADQWLSFKLVEHGWPNQETLTLDLTCGYKSSDDFGPLPTRLFDYMNLSELECLDMDGEGTQPPSIWTTFDQLPGLHTLKVRNSFARSFLEFVRTGDLTRSLMDSTRPTSKSSIPIYFSFRNTCNIGGARALGYPS